MPAILFPPEPPTGSKTMAATLQHPSSPALKETGTHWDKFERLEKLINEPPWATNARQAAMARFAELGFPTVQDEDWRFTNVAPLARLPFRPVFEPSAEGVTAAGLGQFPFARLPGTRLVFVNGHLSPELSSLVALPAGVRIASLRATLASDPAQVEPYLFRQAQTGANAFVALNTAFFQDGAFIHVPAGQSVPEPVQLLYVSTGRENGAAAHPRNLIVADRDSRLTVVESHVRTADAAYFTNAVTELFAGDQAVVEHLKYQDESLQAFHLAALAARFGRGSNVIVHSIAVGARLSRNSLHTNLAGEGLECILNGLYLTRGDQLADHHMIVEHAQPHCASHEYFNGILADRSKGVFHGRILVRPGAQKTDAKQTNKNILLSDEATVDTKPQLEIYADDVRCTHGATVGQLNKESIFYLRTRGIGKETARRMLIHAFAGEIIARIRHEAAREELDQLVWDRLEQHPLVAEPK
jgi:Fe-S cluster assembly protein SufD